MDPITLSLTANLSQLGLVTVGKSGVVELHDGPTSCLLIPLIAHHLHIIQASGT